MGRPEKPLNGSIPEYLAELSVVLREQRRVTGRTFAELAEKTTVSAATLKRATSGSSVPRIETIRQFYAACRPYLPREDQVPIWNATLKAWQLARMEERGTLHARRVRLDYIADRRDLSRELQLFWEKKGAPSVRVIRKYSGDQIVLPLTSLERILRREAVPQTKRQLMAIVRGCFPTKLEEKKWEAAWDKVSRGYSLNGSAN
ncbi:hypothetical protein ACIO53_45180 [Streptomyces sp. NPDC087305]|uniref:hypothetical protein n=1 Tax=Streptomyces sp. NPDC087305 TaxID=3365781 RepID=UPI0038225B2E